MSRGNLGWILLAVIAGGAAGAGSGLLLSPAGNRSALGSAEAAAPSDAALEKRLGELANTQTQLERSLSEVRATLSMLAEAASRQPMQAAPEATQAPRGAEAAKDGAVAAAAPAAVELSAESLLAQLDDPNLDEMERQTLWEKARKAGLLDAMVKTMEERVAREPNNPDLRLDMGKAYLQKIFEVGSGPMAGLWASKADAAFDSALELDPQHWEARFQKAVSLSFWPPAMGKQGQAINEFETLIAQQNAGPKKESHAQTYLFLGNMYQQSGSMEKAVEAWQKGLDLFPDNQTLKQQIQSAKKL